MSSRRGDGGGGGEGPVPLWFANPEVQVETRSGGGLPRRKSVPAAWLWAPQLGSKLQLLMSAKSNAR